MKKSLKAATVTMAASLCMICGVLCGAQSFAHASSVSIEDMKAYLASMDIPEAFLEAVSDEIIEQKYYDYKNAVDVSSVTQISYLSENIYDNSMTFNTIPDDELSFKVTHIRVLHYDDMGIKCIRDVDIYINYNWTKTPRYVKTDGILVNWDANVFNFKSDSFEACTKRVLEKKSTEYVESDEYSNPTKWIEGGLGIDVNLSSKFARQNKLSHKNISGYAHFKLIPYKSPMVLAEATTHGCYSTTIRAEYRHTWNLFKPDVGFSTSGGSISFATSFQTESTTASTFLYYTI